MSTQKPVFVEAQVSELLCISTSSVVWAFPIAIYRD